MTRKHLLVGISTLAFATGVANAQANPNNNSVNTTSTNATSFGNCNNTGTQGNTCRIVQIGDQDIAQVTQGNTDPNSTRNTAIITQIGDRDFATIQQNGNDNFGQLLQGASGARASDNVAQLTQQGFANSTTVRQNGDFNQSFVSQTGGSQDPNTVSPTRPSVAGSGNTVTVTQNATQDQTQVATVSGITQFGNSNSVSVTQNGVSQRSVVQQGASVAVASNSNSVTVLQNGSFGSSTVDQTASNGAANQVTVTNNVADVQQNSETTDGTGFGGAANVSSITQRSSGNNALVRMTGGGDPGNFGTSDADTQNSSTINQSNSLQASTISSNNVARNFLGRGDQLQSTITQDGRNNFAEVTLASGVAGANASVQGGRSTGNSSTVSQTTTVAGGGGSVAVVVAQAARGQTGQGIGNVSQINQTVSVAYQAPTGGVTPAQQGSQTQFFPGSRGQYAVVYQQGQFANATINQTDLNAGGGGSGTVYADGSVGRARAQVFQVGRLASTTVTQQGDNFADVTQGRIGLDVGSVLTLTQIDAGDSQQGGGGFDPQGNPVNTFGRQFNSATIIQYGNGNFIDANQNTVGGQLTLFQSGGPTAAANTSGNYAEIRQGTGATGSMQNLATGAGFSATPSQVGTLSSGLTINVNSVTTPTTTYVGGQGGSNNALRIRQDGVNLTANVVQLGTGNANTGAGTNFNATAGGGGGQSGQANIIQIGQQGTGHRATAIQSANVGQSSGTSAVASGTGAALGEPGAFAGGARSPEIVILQSGTGATVSPHRAFVEQRGKGQVARVEQQGSGNTAGILQDTGATNATARITQTGTGNTYYIVQTQPGEFINVNQSGGGNTAVSTNSAQSGQGTGSFGGTSAPATNPFPTNF